MEHENHILYIPISSVHEICDSEVKACEITASQGKSATNTSSQAVCVVDSYINDDAN